MATALQNGRDECDDGLSITHFASGILASGKYGVTHSKQMSWRSCSPSVPMLSMPPGTLSVMDPMSSHSILKDIHTYRGRLQGSGCIVSKSPKLAEGTQGKYNNCAASQRTHRQEAHFPLCYVDREQVRGLHTLFWVIPCMKNQSVFDTSSRVVKTHFPSLSCFTANKLQLVFINKPIRVHTIL